MPCRRTCPAQPVVLHAERVMAIPGALVPRLSWHQTTSFAPGLRASTAATSSTTDKSCSMRTTAISLDLASAPLRQQVVVNLAAADDDRRTVFGSSVDFGHDRLEPAPGDFLQAEVASFGRSSYFGVMMISGLRERSICRRSRWNICAEFDGTTTCMLCSAQSCR